MKKGWKVILILIILIGIGSILFFFFKDIKKEKNINKKVKTADISKYKDNYAEYMIVKTDVSIYNKAKKKIGSIKKGTKVILDDQYKITDKYYKLKDNEIYIKYSSVRKSDQFTYENEYKTYKNYIPFNLTIKTKDSYELLIDDDIQYEINNQDSYQVVINDQDRYGVAFNDQLYYISKDDVESSEGDINYLGTNSLSVLNYHYTIDKNSNEGRECRQAICMDQQQVEEEIKYLKDNNFYAVTMKDLYLFITGKINLPEKSISITIDDGWYVAKMISILEKYQMQGTLYLIGSLASPNDYKSEYLEIHSHTWDMHKLGVCQGHSRGGGLVCLDDQTVLEDLKKSRESLNNTEVFCYPFYEYNDHAIELLKQAGFKMALAGGARQASRDDDLYLIPRFELSDQTSMDQFRNMVN